MRKRPDYQNTGGDEYTSAASSRQAVQILDRVDVAFIRTGADQQIVYTNASALALWNEAGLDPIGLKLSDSFPERLGTEGQEALSRMIQAGTAATYAYTGQSGRFLMLYPLEEGNIIVYVDTGTTGQIEVSAEAARIASLERELRMLRRNRRQDIIKAIVDTQEQERRRIAETLHVEIGQLLSAVKIQLRHISSQEAEKMINEAIRTVRGVSFELMPSLLRDFGLESALRDMIDKKLLAEGIQCKLSYRVPAGRLNDEVNLVLFRIVQELINNVVRHAGASQVMISLMITGRKIQLLVRDNGRGIDPGTVQYGFGLLSIRNRVQMMQGSFRLEKENGEFSVEITLPYGSTDQPVDKGVAD